MGDVSKVIAVFKALEITPNLDDFQNKLVMQKTICLLEYMGLNSGFSFGLNVRGAYSRGLTNALYDNRSDVEGLKTSSSLSASEQELVSTFQEVMPVSKPSLLEIAATYVVLIKACGLKPRDAIKQLKDMKPFFSEAEFAIGISKAKQLVPMVSEDDIKAMNAEFSPWDRASDEDSKKWM